MKNKKSLPTDRNTNQKQIKKSHNRIYIFFNNRKKNFDLIPFAKEAKNKKKLRCVRRISCRITFFDKCALIRHARYL